MGLDGLETRADLERFVLALLERQPRDPERAVPEARSNLSVNQVYASLASTYLNFTTKVRDTAGMRDDANVWKLIAPTDGLYLGVVGGVSFTPATGGVPKLELWQNLAAGGATLLTGTSYPASVSAGVTETVVALARMAKGDSLSALFTNTTAGGMTVTTGWLELARLGG
jgi:hypothetical protein